jgi:hypothetical protein
MITTKDCVEYIVNYLIQKENNYTNIKDWKRLSKKGTGSNIIRKFQNKVTGREVEIRSSDTEIFEILKKDKTIGMFGLPVGTVVDFSKEPTITLPNGKQQKIDNFNDFKNTKKINKNSSIRYFAWFDQDSNCNVIAFGIEKEILKDCLTGRNLPFDEIDELRDIFNDDGSLCEDYLISTDVSLSVIDNELLNRGFTRDIRMKNVGWG